MTSLGRFFRLCLYEKNLSALQSEEKESPWISREDEIQGWKEDTAAEACEGQEETDTLNGGIAEETRDHQKKERL